MEYKTYCEGDSYLIEDVLEYEFSKSAFQQLQTTTPWTKMQHRGGDIPRLISVQGKFGKKWVVKCGDSTSDNASAGRKEELTCYPMYRHPADKQLPCTPFEPVVEQIAEVLNTKYKHLLAPGCVFNHVLVQWYRNGLDLITEHADKTLDINKGTPVVNVSLGSMRTMTLRTKEKYGPEGSSKKDLVAKRKSESVELPHNSMFVLGIQTNQKWVHGIRANKQREADEQWNGRISLTFRSIGTFASSDDKWIMGIGVEGGLAGKEKSRAGNVEHAYPVEPGPEGPNISSLFHMFAEENRSSTLTRDEIYRSGSRVVLLN